VEDGGDPMSVRCPVQIFGVVQKSLDLFHRSTIVRAFHCAHITTPQLAKRERHTSPDTISAA